MGFRRECMWGRHLPSLGLWYQFPEIDFYRNLKEF